MSSIADQRPNNKNILIPTKLQLLKKSKLDHPESSQPTETRDMCCQATQQGCMSPHENSESITTCVKSCTHINSARQVDRGLIVENRNNHHHTKQYGKNQTQSELLSIMFN